MKNCKLFSIMLIAVAFAMSACKDDNKVELLSITIDPLNDLTIEVDASFQLTALAHPAAYGEITTAEWTSDNPDIAVVSASGMLTAKKVGKARIRAKYGVKDAAKTITVVPINIPLKSINITPAQLAMDVSQKVQLAVELVPANATGVSLTYVSNNANVATVSATGEVEAIGVGDAEITVSSGDITSKVAVRVDIPLTDITVTPASIEMIQFATQQLTTALVPADASNVKLSFSSSDEAIAIVSDKGLITAKGAGDVVITVSDGGNISKTVAVKVHPGVDRSAWTATSSSIMGNDVGAKAFDGDNNTMWHSGLSGLPQWLQIDMKTEQTIYGFLWTNRQETDQKALPRYVSFEVSADGYAWTNVLNTEIPNSRTPGMTIPLTAPVTARYIKITVNTTWDAGATYSYIAEFNIYMSVPPGKTEDHLPLRFNTTGTACSNDNTSESGVDIITTTGGVDPNIMTNTGLPRAINSGMAWIRFKYKSTAAMTRGEFYLFPQGQGPWGSGQQQRFLQTDEWTTFQYQIPADKANAMKAGDALRLDLDDNVNTVFKVKDLEIYVLR